MFTLLGAAVLGALALLAILQTTAGSRWVLQRLADSVPGEITFEGVSGRLGSRLTIERFHYRQLGPDGELSGQELEASDLELEWSPLRLVRRGVAISRLSVADVVVRLPPATEDDDDEPTVLPEVRLPVSIRIGSLEIDELSIVSDDESEPIVVSSVEADRVRVPAGGGALRFDRFSAEAPGWRLESRGQVTPIGDYPLDIDAEWSVLVELEEDEQPAQVWIDGAGSLTGTVADLAIEQRLTVPTGDAPSGAEVVVAGIVHQPLNDLSLELEASWDALRWPLEGEALALSRDGRLIARGPLDDLALDLESRLEGPQIPSGSWSASAVTDLRRIDVDRLSGRLLSGEVSGRVEAEWVDQTSWSAELTGSGLDPSGHWPDYPGDIGFELRAFGRGGGDATVVSLRFDELQGELRSYPLFGQGQLEIDGQDIRVSGLELVSGTAVVRAQGELGEQWQLAFDLTAPDLEQVIADAGGSLRATGTLSGSRERPEVRAQLEAGDLRFRELTVGSVTGSIASGLTFSSPITAALEMREVGDGQRQIRELDIEIDGTLAEHRLQLDASANQGSLALVGAGGLFDEEARGSGGAGSTLPSFDGWSGRLQTLALSSEEWGGWRLEETVTVVLSASEVTVDDSCWLQDTAGRNQAGEVEARLCVGGAWRSAAPWQMAAQLERFPLELLGPLVPEGYAATGRATGAATTSGIGTRFDQASVDLSAETVTAVMPRPGGESAAVEMTNLELTGQLDEAGLRVGFETGLTDAEEPDANPGQVVVDLAIDGFRFEPGAEQPAQPWRLTADLEEAPLLLIAPFLPEGYRVEGLTRAQVTAQGVGTELSRADLEARVSSLRAEVPQVGGGATTVELRSLILLGSLDPEGLEGRLSGTVEEGRFAANARLPGFDPAAGVPPPGQRVQGEIDVELSDLELIEALIPNLRDLEGSLTARGSFDGTFESPGVDARIELEDFRGRVVGIEVSAGSQPVDLAFANAALLAGTDASGAHIDLRLDLLDPAGKVEAKIELPGYSPTADTELAAQPLAGTIVADLDSLDPISRLLPRLRIKSGELQGRLDVGGTLGDPDVGGRAALTGFTGELPELGIDFEDGAITASGQLGEALTVEGSLRSGPGTVEVGGRAEATETGFVADLTIDGSNFAVANTPEIRIRASPDLDIHLEPGLIQIDGEVGVPWARINLRELPESRLEPSPDVVVVRDDGPVSGEVEEPEPPTVVVGRVRVRLGEEVQFRGLGFDTEPEGTILVTLPRRGPVTATGQLRLDGGQYAAYGQNLRIEVGRLFFGGGPIENPGLDVQAYRTVGTVKAGVDVGGTLEQPTVRLVSNRPLSESDILHYMMLGRAPGTTTTQSEGDLLTRAATALGLRQGNELARKIAAKYGLDELRLEGGSSLEQASLVIGKFLSPRLYVSYGVGLFEPISTFSVRYLLSAKLTLLAEKGRGTGADLLYTIETGKRQDDDQNDDQDDDQNDGEP